MQYTEHLAVAHPYAVFRTKGRILPASRETEKTVKNEIKAKSSGLETVTINQRREPG